MLRNTILHLGRIAKRRPGTGCIGAGQCVGDVRLALGRKSGRAQVETSKVLKCARCLRLVSRPCTARRCVREERISGHRPGLRDKRAAATTTWRPRGVTRSPSRRQAWAWPTMSANAVRVLLTQKLENNPSALPPDVIDVEVFEQLLEMDEEDDRDFSKSLVYNYFEQAESTFEKMHNALYVSGSPRSSQSLSELSTLGHFLKGSSAAVGVIKVRNSCETMQHYGTLHDADGVTELSREEAIAKLTQTTAQVKQQYDEAKATLRAFFGA